MYINSLWKFVYSRVSVSYRVSFVTFLMRCSRLMSNNKDLLNTYLPTYLLTWLYKANTFKSEVRWPVLCSVYLATVTTNYDSELLSPTSAWISWKNAFSHRITYRDTTVLCLHFSCSTLYGSETWSMTQVVRIRLDTFEQRWLRLSLRVSFPDRCSNADRWFGQVETHHRKPLELGDSVSLVTLREPSLRRTTHVHCTHLHTYHRRTGSVQLTDQGQRGCRLWNNAHPDR